MNGKQCPLVVAGLIFVQSLYLFTFTLLNSMLYGDAPTMAAVGIAGILVLTVAVILGLYFMIFQDVPWVMPIFVGLASVYNILFSTIYSAYNTDTASILLTVFLLIAYIVTAIAPRKAKPVKNDKFYLFGVTLFSVLACTNFEFAFSITLFTAFAVLVFLIYLLLHYTVSLKPFVAYITIGIDGILTIVYLCLSTNFDIEQSVYLFSGHLVIWFLILGAYILFDVFSNSGTIKKSKPVKSYASDLSFDGKIQKLEELQKLRESGILTEEEFQAQKNKILLGGSHV